MRVLPHPAPRQTASLRAVAYPLVQEARRWPPPSLRLVWPVRLSVVVTWRRDPTSVCWPSFPPTVPPAGAPFPPRGLVGSIPPLRRYYETLRPLAAHPPALRCLRPAVPSEHLRFAPSDARCDVHGLGLGEPVPAPRRSLRWRRRGLPVPGKPTRTHATRSDPGEVAASTASETRRDDLPSNARRRPSHSLHFGAQSRGLRAPCERFAPWVTPGPRITRFRLAADLGRMGLDTHRISNKVSKITSRHLVPLDRAFPAHAVLHESSLAHTMPTDRILICRCDMTLVGRAPSSD